MKGKKRDRDLKYMLCSLCSLVVTVVCEGNERERNRLRKIVLSVLTMGVFALWLMSSVAKVPGSLRGCRVRALLL